MKLFNKLFAVSLMFCSTLSVASQEIEESINSESEKVSVAISNSPNCQMNFDRPIAYINKDGGAIANRSLNITSPDIHQVGGMFCRRAGNSNPFIGHMIITPDVRGFAIPANSPPDQYFCTFVSDTSSGPEFCTASIEVACPVGSVWDNEAKICKQSQFRKQFSHAY